MGFFQDHAGDGNVPRYRLYYIGFAAPAYWTDCDLDIVWNGFTWKAKPILAGAVSFQPDGNSASFKIGDADGSLFTALAAVNGGELAIATIYEAGFLTTNQTAVPDEVIEIFSGRVDRVNVVTDTEDTLEFVLMPPALSGSIEFPQRMLATMVRAS